MVHVSEQRVGPLVEGSGTNDRIMDDIDPAEWGEAAQRQLCYEIKARLASLDS